MKIDFSERSKKGKAMMDQSLTNKEQTLKNESF